MAIPVLSGAIILGTVVVVANAKTAPESISTDILSIDEAKAFAEKEVDGFVTGIELEDEKKGFVYEVDVQTDDMEYELKLDAKTGDVLKIEKEAQKDHKMDKESQALIADGKLITEEKAIEIATEQATGILTEVKLKNKDGRHYYKIEIQDDQFEHEFKINAVNGEILKYKQEALDD